MDKVQYRIEGDILFCPNTAGFYHNELQDEPISIPSPAARLLSFLIKNKGEIVEREVLLQKVWDDYGMQASNNNLNQCLSTLRRIIKSMGVEKSIIETIPKVGLRIAEDITIEEINHIEQTVEATEKPIQKNTKCSRKINLFNILVTLVIILIVTTVVHIFHLRSYFSQNQFNSDFMGVTNAYCELPLASSQHSVPDLFPPLMSATAY
ncbi:DNA-binding winged helix-turn-helix (wHTH) protein [Serratia fonticola]|uniref:DNA-binding winged helix-turn-helix (WHTH) protein n=1 Tax=Serratia fonticola TaxID=47917 RepID=A0A542BP02_SERFO|nr:winged helix-turn-helix domain-containing protein [Serratia fonticola]TQI80275.1 DNA-binding winged helix-turn-helix (wHTH) protein [Serratia fonticola]TQI97698.1 DNA-binding winged helix-turn-helix (wHTH) protein [Serratia fonticola]TVZ72196.1 DNA-binding winged helix-turn-helix (wHTH) protein [Serratia fonticola]